MTKGSKISHELRPGQGIFLNDSPTMPGLIVADFGNGPEVMSRKYVKVISMQRALKLKSFDSAVVEEFVSYLKRTNYSLVPMIRAQQDIEKIKLEYFSWSGERLTDSVIRACTDKNKNGVFGRQWFLTFKHDPAIKYPFQILPRGSGNKKRMGTGWIREDGTVEYCYASGIGTLVSGGLRAKKTLDTPVDITV